MVSPAERAVARRLRSILSARPIGANLLQPDTADLRRLLSWLDRLIEEVLLGVYADWEHERLDGVLPYLARKSAEREAELFGLCVLISDQAPVPFHLQLEIAETKDEVTWLTCKLGERGTEGLIRAPHESIDRATKRMITLSGKTDQISWFYSVAFGKRTS
jgi:hypothetical protein